LAFPVFQKHGVSATFFLVTTFVGTGFLPWWDEIAYMVKCSAQPQIKLVYPKAVAFDKKAEGEAQTLMAILKLFKLSSSIDTERFLNELSLATRCRRPGSHSERCFLNWDEAREMQQAGMCFGSHTHTHEILARLPYERQVEELRVSRQIMERELGGEVDTLAYPSGEEGTFSETTFAALREAKYRTAFSYYAGVNLPGKIDVLDVLRAGVDNEGRPTFRLRAAMYAATGRGLV
jgi:peptidoglycan/xylan/chitin deacetylase (PgdA/CDA1 family)